MSAATTEGPTESCWTESHAMRHCEGFRVIGPDGPTGYVEEVWMYEDGEVSALVVEATRPKIVSAGDVLRVDELREIVTVRRLRDLGETRRPAHFALPSPGL